MKVKAFISANLWRPDLSTAAIADEHHISVRCLQKLCEGEGETVAGWIRAQRLEH